MSIIASHSPLISRKPLEIEAWFQTPKDYQQEMAHVESNSHVIYDVPHMTLKGQGHEPQYAKAQYLENS